MTIWMDFNPLNYMGCDTPLFMSGDVGFRFYWRGCVYVFVVVLTFKDSDLVFVLYERVYPARIYPMEYFGDMEDDTDFDGNPL